MVSRPPVMGLPAYVCGGEECGETWLAMRQLNLAYENAYLAASSLARSINCQPAILPEGIAPLSELCS